MNDRLVTLAGALGALALVFILLAPPAPTDPERRSRPTSVDRGPAGLAGLARWLRDGRVPVVSLRRGYGTLDSDTRLAPTGNLLIATLPHARERRADDGLVEWVRRGNQLLVMASVSESLDWLEGADFGSTSDVLESLGLEMVEGDADGDASEEAVDEPSHTGSHANGEHDVASDGVEGSALGLVRSEEVTLTPVLDHPVTEGVSSVSASRIALFDAGWTLLVDSPPGPARLTLLERASARGEPGLWEVRIGDGRVWVAPHSGLFDNVTLARADNATLFANLVRASVRGGGSVVFDDGHQGLADVFDPEALYRDPRLHQSLALLVGLWLLLIVGRAQRLTAPRPAARGADASQLAAALSGVLARRVSDAAVAERLYANLFNELRASARLPVDGQPVWDLLERSPHVSEAELSRLRAGHAAAARGARLDLTRIAALMARIRERMT